MIEIVRPPGIRAGFQAVVADRAAGLHHAGEQWAPSRFLIDRHTHEVWELYLQVHGLSRWRADNALFTLRPGHLFAVGPGVEHQMADHPAEHHHFYFAAIDIPAVCHRHPALAPRWAQPPKVIHRDQAHAAIAPFAELTRELTSRLDLAADGLRLAVDRLVLEVTRLLDPTESVPLRTVHPAAARVRDLIDRDPVRGWTLRELAADVGLAGSYLAGVFTAEFGMSPHRYLTERRIERASRLLTGSDLPVTAIGIDVGFSSGQHFARVFRQLTGVTPREFRRNGLIGAAAEPRREAR